MRLRRETAHKIHYFLDQWLPPVLRDARWFMHPLFKAFYGPLAEDFLDFKDRAVTMSPDDFAAFYAKVAEAPPKRDTHLTQACLDAVLQEAQEVQGATSVLDVGAGKCFLIKRLFANAAGAKAVACDVHLDPRDLAGHPGIEAVQAPIGHLPFPDRSFDVVTCTHTLEHVMDLHGALSELRRVTARKLVIVVPRQRPYRHTFDPHVRFFPYRINIAADFGHPMGPVTCALVDGDWLYTETRT